MKNIHTDPKAIFRMDKLPACIVPHVRVNDPSWSVLPAGWFSLVVDLHNNLVKVYPDYEIIQVKEKFGGLRFYTDIPYDENDIGHIVIQHYEVKSFHVCDQCGETGGKVNVGHGHYVATRCQEHR